MKTTSLLVIDYRGITFNDPPLRNGLEYFIKNNVRVTVLLSSKTNGVIINPVPGCRIIHFDKSIRFLRDSLLYKFVSPLLFIIYVKYYTFIRRVDFILTIMLQPLAALSLATKKSFVISCILDIPPTKTAGKIDRVLNRNGWLKLKNVDLIWTSDIFKAALIRQKAGIGVEPIVVHNCPRKNYFSDIGPGAENRLRNYLIASGKSISNNHGIILLRAGAVGEDGGIEETLEAMKDLPEHYVFVLMGRPSYTYKQSICSLVEKYSLTDRVALLDRVSDSEWKQNLLDADIGHLIHINPDNDSSRNSETFKLNSSLSNNRLFQYMAAGIPIISYKDYRMDAIYKEVDCFEIVDTQNLVGDIREAWKYLAENDSLRRKMGENGHKAYLNKYNWEHQFYSLTKKIGFNAGD